MLLDSHEIPAAQLCSAANAPEVHAAAIIAAKDYLLSRRELADMPSFDMASTIAMHAAFILRVYLDAVGDQKLLTEAVRVKSQS